MPSKEELFAIFPTAKFLISLRIKISSLLGRFLIFSGKEFTRFNVTNDSAKSR